MDGCPYRDDPPELVEKQAGSGEDDTPQTLDPGDTWVYRCENRTADPGTDCEPFRVDNTGTVTAGTVQDDDSISTVLRTLQRRVTPRVTLGPGRYRLTARVTFEPGAGTPPVTLSRVIRVCAAAQPRFTG